MSGSVSADPRIGTVLAGYRVERLLGRGGMSVVYLAEDTRLSRKVALKLLAPELAEDERFRERFLRESRLAASIDHPNVIPIYEAGETEGVLFIAMRYVEGSDLKRLLEQEGRLEPARALALLSQVANALDEAHAHGLVHRDVKPGNVLLAAHEHVYLADFGLTKQTGSESGLTETGQFVGTANYVSPEQVERQPATPASDLYALGCVLYECLAGEAPYRSESLMGVLYGHASAPIPSVHQHRPELRQAIDGVLARALAKKPDDRYPSCRHLVDDARRALDLTGEAPPAPTFTRKRLLLASAGVLAAAVAAAVPAVLLTRRGDEQIPPLVIEPGSLVRIDPATNEPVAAIPARCDGPVAVGEGAVWAGNLFDGTVSRIDPDSARVTRTVSARPASFWGIAAGEGAAWVAGTSQGEASLAEIDPADGRLKRVHRLGYLDAYSAAVGHGAVWVSVNDLTQEGAVQRIDPSTGRIVASVPLPGRTYTVATGEGAVWVASAPGGGSAPEDPVWQIDPVTSALVETIPGLGGGTLAAGEGSAWIVAFRDVVRYDPASSRVAATIELGFVIGFIAVGAGSVWVTDYDAPRLARIDPTTGRVAEIDLTGHGDFTFIGNIAADAEGVWVGVIV